MASLAVATIVSPSMATEKPSASPSARSDATSLAENVHVSPTRRKTWTAPAAAFSRLAPRTSVSPSIATDLPSWLPRISKTAFESISFCSSAAAGEATASRHVDVSPARSASVAGVDLPVLCTSNAASPVLHCGPDNEHRPIRAKALYRFGLPASGAQRVADGSSATRPPISTLPSSSGRAWITDPAPWRISIWRPSSAGEEHRGRAGGLVLVDPERAAGTPARARSPRPRRSTPSARACPRPSGGPCRASTRRPSRARPDNSAADPTPAARRCKRARPRRARRARRPAGAARRPSRARARAARPCRRADARRSRSSVAGVKMRTSAAGTSSTNTVSLKPIAAAAAWRSAGGTTAPVRNTATLLPPLPSAAQNTRRTL